MSVIGIMLIGVSANALTASFRPGSINIEYMSSYAVRGTRWVKNEIKTTYQRAYAVHGICWEDNIMIAQYHNVYAVRGV